MRAFVAVDIAEQVLSEIEDFIARMRDRMTGARWVVPRNIHLTLRFLGESDRSTLAAVAASLESVSSRHGSFSLSHRGIGFFPSARRPRIFWVGLDPLPEALRNLQKEVETVAQLHRFEPETRRYSPHLTLARFRNPRSDRMYEEITREFEGRDFGTTFVPDLVLYQSILKKEGTEYRALKRLALSA